MIIEILKNQLEVANATNIQQNLTIQRLNTLVEELNKRIKNLEQLLLERDESLGKISNQLRGVNAIAFPKSEKQSPKKKEETESEYKARKEEQAAIRKERGNNNSKRKVHFELETVQVDVYPDNVDSDQYSQYVKVGVRDVVRYMMIPPKFIKKIFHLHNLRKDGIVYTAKTPVSPLLNSAYDSSFIAGMAELRYLHSMPVERIIKYFHSHGFDIDKATAHGLLAKTAYLCEKLYKAMEIAVKEDNYLHCDESYHTVLVEKNIENPKGSKRGYIWALAAAHTGLVYFFYEDGSRRENIILDKLHNYQGVIQSDGLKSYQKVANLSNGSIIRVGCLQHCKRDFLDDSLKNNTDAQKVVELSNLLYQNENQHRIGDNGWTKEDNLKWRQSYAPKILKKLKYVLERIRGNDAKYPPKSIMHKASNYFLNEWDSIEAIASYGDVSWDNNLIERLNRYISLSRHNSLFFGSHEGAQRGCVYYSLACSCRNNGIDFFEYFTDILNKVAQMPNGSSPEAYRNLLPDRWVK